MQAQEGLSRLERWVAAAALLWIPVAAFFAIDGLGEVNADAKGVAGVLTAIGLGSALAGALAVRAGKYRSGASLLILAALTPLYGAVAIAAIPLLLAAATTLALQRGSSRYPAE